MVCTEGHHRAGLQRVIIVDTVLLEKAEAGVFIATVGELEKIEYGAIDVAFDVEEATVEVAAVGVVLEFAYVIVHIEVVSHTAAKHVGIARGGLESRLVVGACHVDGEEESLVDFEII